MNVLAFAVADAEGPDIDADFYGFAPEVQAVDDIATIVVDSAEPPAATDDTLLAHHRLVEAIAAERACLPHRFGLIVDSERLRDDLRRNRDALAAGLDAVRGRSEWLLRGRARPSEIATRVAAQHGAQRPRGGALEVGEWVHGLVVARLEFEAQAIAERLASRRPWVEVHDDGLGFDVVMSNPQGDDDELAAAVNRECEPRAEYLEFELFGPTPCYRHSDRLLGALT